MSFSQSFTERLPCLAFHSNSKWCICSFFSYYFSLFLKHVLCFAPKSVQFAKVVDKIAFYSITSVRAALWGGTGWETRLTCRLCLHQLSHGIGAWWAEMGAYNGAHVRDPRWGGGQAVGPGVGLSILMASGPQGPKLSFHISLLSTKKHTSSLIMVEKVEKPSGK